MERIVAYCGLICNDCDAFIATKNNDILHKVKLSQEWSSPSYKISPDEVSCMGCNADSNSVFKFCRECKVRLCGIKKNKDNCAHCEDYPCSKLDTAFKNVKNKEVLDKIRNNL